MKLILLSQNHLSKKLGLYFKEHRVKKGLQQREVAKALGYSSPQFISNIERGLSLPPLNKIKKLIKLYGMPAEEVLQIILKEQERALSQAIVGGRK